MELYTKFESRSSRAKAIAFHPTRPWVLVGLYSSTIQLWDYRMGWIVDRFEGHQGPVRGLDVHPTQQIFVSCGDDQLIRVWSLTDRRLLFSLEGHQDYVRTAFFHPELPWIVSSSDDQTVRIWDWQARREIALLTGHSHWVSCAIFHPTEDLIISSSLDCTVRAWDISGLRRKHSAAGVLPGGMPPGVSGGFPGGPPGFPGGPPGFPGGPPGFNPGFNGGFNQAGGPPGASNADLFGDLVVTKFILEGHDRGVTWVACHPTQPLILSSSDDRTLKVWRTSESRAWEIDTCRGHRDEVTGCAFDPYSDVIVSCSADETLRTWDINKRTPISTFRRPPASGADAVDRYWGVFFHPTLNLIGAALDTGATVFKMSYERPAYISHPHLAYVSRDKTLKVSSGSSTSNLGSVAQSVSGQTIAPRLLSYNPSENAYLCSYVQGIGASSDAAPISTTTASSKASHTPSNGIVVMYSAGSGGKLTEQFKINGVNGLFVSRNRFVVLQQGGLVVCDMSSAVTKSAELPFPVHRLAATPVQNQVLLLGDKVVALYDLQQRQVVTKLAAAETRRAVWSPSGEYVALLSKHDVVIANKKLEQVTKLFETIRVKDLAWDQNLPVVVYSTFSHLKYGLLNGDHGVLCTLEEIHYVTGAHGAQISLLNRKGELVTKHIDPTEYRFKLALISRNFAEVARLIQTSQLVGQSIIAYLQQRGYPEIALEFVQDPKTRLDLAVEAGDLAAASAAASQLQGKEFDEQLGRAALEQGNHDVLEDVLQRQQDLDKLALVYALTGNRSRLQKLEQLSMQRNNASARFSTSLLLNSVENRMELLQQAGLGPLAYALAKSRGLDDEADQIREEAGKKTTDIQITVKGDLTTPSVRHDTWRQNWPVKKRETVDIMNIDTSSVADAGSGASGAGAGAGAGAAAGTAGAAAAGGAGAVVDEDAWDIDDELEDGMAELNIDDNEAGSAGAVAGAVGPDWAQKSTVPADHIAAGAFESAAQLLHNQIGAVRFEPLKQRFFDVYSANHLAVPGHDGLPPLEYRVLRSGDSAQQLPYVPGYDQLQARLQEAFNQVKSNQLELAIDSFRSVLHTAVTLAVQSEKEEQEVKKIIELSRNYILAFSIEVRRRSLPKEDAKRNLELAAYFTKPQLKPAHAVLPLRTAAVQAANAKSYNLASHFAAEYLKHDSSSAGAKKMEANKQRWDQAKSMDAVAIDFDMYAQFDIDPISLTPIYEGQPVVYDLLTRAKYHAEHKGDVCAITGFTSVGAAGPGLRLRA